MALSKAEKPSNIFERTQMYKTVLSTRGVQGLLEELKENADEWKSVKISVAVTGNAGTGKSTFINTLFGLKDEDAAKSDIVECTRDIMEFHSPKNPNVTVYDLPGVGTPKFPKKTYMHDVNLEKYDFFIIMAKCRFTENDTWLARELKNLGKKFYFVRSHTQEDIENDKESHPKTHNPQKVVQKIRNDCKKKLGENLQTEIFLIDSLEPSKYDMGNLVKAFIEETAGIKANILVACLVPLTQEILDFKYQALQANIFSVALKFRDVKRKIDADKIARNTISEEMANYIAVFGIDEDRLKKDRELFKLSEMDSDFVSVDLEELCAKIMDSADFTILLHNLGMQELMKDFQGKILFETSAQAILTMKIMFGILHRLYEFASKLYKKVPTQFAKKCCEIDNDN